ncbi:MAG: hypothetical protein ACYCSN_13560 [Acidobacteriaceae bacterium]
MPRYEVLQRWVNKLISFCLVGFAAYSLFCALDEIRISDRAYEFAQLVKARKAAKSAFEGGGDGISAT